MAKKQFNLDNLFMDVVKPETQTVTVKPEDVKQEVKKAKSNKSVRSIYIDDDLWNDFMVLVKLNGGKTVEVTNNIIKKAVDENREKIEAFKSLMSNN